MAQLLTRAKTRMTLRGVTDAELAIMATACDLTLLALAGVSSTLTRANRAVRDGITREQERRRSSRPVLAPPAPVGVLP